MSDQQQQNRSVSNSATIPFPPQASQPQASRSQEKVAIPAVSDISFPSSDSTAQPLPINGIRIGNSLCIFFTHSLQDVDPAKVLSAQACNVKTGETKTITYSNLNVVANGSFGVVFQAKIHETGDLAAIKKVIQDRRFKVYSLRC